MNTPLEIEAVAKPQDVKQPTMALERRGPVGDSYESLMALAKDLCATGFLPEAVKTPAQAVAIILTGRELGLGPMQSLRSICIIKGKPELAADLQLSIFHRDGGRSKWLALTEQKAVLWLKHPNGDEHTETFTMDDARRAGLAVGQNWQKYPKAMLRSRAITAGLKSAGFEPLSGAYAPGEVGGPEIVGPEPETIPETTAPAPKPAPPTQVAKPATTETLGGPPLKLATAATRAWMMKELDPCRDLATEYFQKLDKPAVLLPTEPLEELPWEWVPITKNQLALLRAAITDFGNGSPAVHPYAPNPVQPDLAEAQKKKRQPKTEATKPAPAAEAPKPKRDPEWFMAVICPIPRKGMKKAEYDKAPDTIGSMYKAMKEGDETAQHRLWGFANKWAPAPREANGRTYQPSEADKVFREALDDFIEWERKHGKDTEQAPENVAAGIAKEAERLTEDDDIPF